MCSGESREAVSPGIGKPTGLELDAKRSDGIA